MNSLAVNNLKPGMVFTEAVYIDDTNLLVVAGIPIKQKDIDNLNNWDIDTIYSGGTACPNKEEYVQLIAQKLNRDLSLSDVNKNKGAYRIYTSLIERMDEIFEKIAARNENVVDDQTINIITTQLVEVLAKHRERFLGFILGGDVKGNDMAKSSVNTAILSAVIAQKLKLPRYKVFNVIIGALLHDVGMLRLPGDIMGKKGTLSEEELNWVWGHPLYSQMIVIKELSYSDEVGDIVLQHHECWDGDGYPYHLMGENINLCARIVSIADAFEAMISQKPYRNSMAGYEAMKTLFANSSHRFDPALIKAFVVIMGIYPIGSFVRLNNNAVARVFEVRADSPLRPKIQLLIDENKKRYKNEHGPRIDLLMEKKLYITQAMETKELLTHYA